LRLFFFYILSLNKNRAKAQKFSFNFFLRFYEIQKKLLKKRQAYKNFATLHLCAIKKNAILITLQKKAAKLKKTLRLCEINI